MYYHPAEKEHDRIGISVGKKIGNAVERNRVKRQVRMMIVESCDFNSGYDYVFIIRSRFLQSDYQNNKKICHDYIIQFIIDSGNLNEGEFE